ncbi:hypothetical protein MGU_07016 [Metarhizium guizhouense ARSEF 977]|uniref:Uncharacterized protein n=1 Tax=Metarhizium guizhouense (strain ARSEF 977) TaxID=1276136 RepID=A0A0B4H1N3_METGA|nr:hypothetical protein MGU_07016 [Metarhizium guizhouense ARSEF 977]
MSLLSQLTSPAPRATRFISYESALNRAPTRVTSAGTAGSFQYHHRLGALSEFSGSYLTDNLQHLPSGLLSKEVINLEERRVNALGGLLGIKAAKAGSCFITKPAVSAAARKSISATVKSAVRGIARGYNPGQAAARGGLHLTGLSWEDSDLPADQQRPLGVWPAGTGSRVSTGRNEPAQVGSQSYYLCTGSSVAQHAVRPAMKIGGNAAVTGVLRYKGLGSRDPASPG